MSRKVQIDKVQRTLKVKEAFVRMIKNCIFKSKFYDFLERTNNRLKEKAFDKIKENNWIIEERKEVIEEILMKLALKNYFLRFK